MTQSFDAHQNAETYILVAEDDQVTRMVLKKLLEQTGYHADFVGDGHEAIEALKLMDYDLVLMDCIMPRLDGFAATQMIRNSRSRDINANIPVIAMTGLTGEADRARCLDAGMDDHIGKPVKADELVKAIAKNLGRMREGPSVPQKGTDVANPAWDGDFLDTMLEIFLAEIPDVVERLQLAVARRDLADLERIGHRLRGASDILEIHNLSSRSQALEKAGKDGDFAQAERLASELVSALQEMAAALNC